MATGSLSTASNLPRARWQDLVLPLGLIACVLVILVPMPPAILDVMLAGNVALAVVILLTTVYVRTPLEFSVFPSLLLATTLTRLVLNVATTRLILTRADVEGSLAAGHVVQAFGEFVAGNQLAVGFVIFAIVVIIQFVVITKGATRIGEVAARFALDGMPGKQMAIDAELNAGAITQAEAQRRRQEIHRQADFFAAMDGAGKFVRGDAIAGILITLVNIVGGLAIGVLRNGMSVEKAADVFTRLTIGDGLVTQVPAFLISVAAGLLVTRSSIETNLPSEFLKQLFSRPQALVVAGLFLGVLMFTGLPPVPLFVLGGGCVGMAFLLTRQRQREAVEAEAQSKQQAAKKPAERVEDFLATDPLEIEFGAGLIRLADPKRGGDLLDRIQATRKRVAAELGIIMPKVRVRDNMRLESTQYRIKLSDVPIAEGTIEPGMLLAIDNGAGGERVRGIETEDPASGRAATWIEPALREQARASGYTVLEPAGVIASHLLETVRRSADELLTRDATKHLIEELKKTAPAVVEELIPGQMKLADVQRILQMLLREQVSIRQLGLILESLGEQTDGAELGATVELVRARLARVLSTQYRDVDGKLHVAVLDAAMEDRIESAIEHEAGMAVLRLPPQAVARLCRQISDGVEKLVREGLPAVVLVRPAIRAALKQATQSRLPRLAVLSYNEVTRDTKVEAVTTISQWEGMAVGA